MALYFDFTTVNVNWNNIFVEKKRALALAIYTVVHFSLVLLIELSF